MTWHNKVMWTEGMFLQPQHFQQQDRFLGRQADARIAASVPWPWGYAALQLDDAALQQGRVMLASARGVLPDGLAFSIPADDPAPPALEVPVDARDELLVLAVAQARPGVPESDVESAEGSMPPRWRASDVMPTKVMSRSARRASSSAEPTGAWCSTASMCRRCCTPRRIRCSTATCAKCMAC